MRPSCPTTRPGSSCSSSCAMWWSMRPTPTGASSAATSRTSCGAWPASVPTTARHPGSCAARPPSAIPAELARTLTGRQVRVIDRNGAPIGREARGGPRPARPSTGRTGARPGPSGLARRSALAFLRAGRQTIVFGRSRVQVELLLTSLREQLREGRGPIDRVRGYRGGYLPSERRAIEAGLRTGEILGVVSTTALELGIDIGRLDVAVIAGYPGTISGTWQQIGRAGRRQEVSVAILVAGAGALDRYVASHPDYLFEATAEEARLDPENIHVLLAHLRAATFELPFGPGERFGATTADDLLAFLAEEGHVRQADDQRWYWASENFPASEISLRVAAPGERAHHRYRPGSTPGHRRGGPVLGAHAGPRGRHLSPRVPPVPRGPARLGRAQGVRAAGGRRPLHPGGARRHAQAPGHLRRGEPG